MARVLIVGANRGIGLELCRQMAARGDDVIATTRSPAPALDEIPDVEVRSAVDVTAPESSEALAAELGESSIDVLFMVAGILERVGLDDFDAGNVRRQFEVNALGVLSTTVTLLRCVRDGGKIAFLSSRMGSIADNTSGGSYGYRMSKAALNMAGRSLSLDLRPRNIAVGILHPGWVSTDMTAGQGLIDAATSATGLLQRLDTLTLSTSGEFFHENGEQLPW